MIYLTISIWTTIIVSAGTTNIRFSDLKLITFFIIFVKFFILLAICKLICAMFYFLKQNDSFLHQTSINLLISWISTRFRFPWQDLSIYQIRIIKYALINVQTHLMLMLIIGKSTPREICQWQLSPRISIFQPW